MNDIKKTLKKLLHIIYDVIYFPKVLLINNIVRKANQDKVMLIGTPLHRNLGDHLIAVAEKKMLEDMYHHDIVEIPTSVYLKYRNYLKNKINRNVKIYISGGGWMGSLWPQAEYRMQDMIRCFSKNSIVVLPQTVYYEMELQKAQDILRDAIETYKQCTRLILCFRDQYSFDFAKKYFQFNNTKILLAPDIALYHECIQKNNNQKGIACCLRNDREKMVDNNIFEWTKEYCAQNDKLLVVTDTMTKYKIPYFLRNKKVSNKINYLSQYELVITDRLHGMIFSHIANTKCLVINNKTNKVKGVFELWLNRTNNIIFCDLDINKEMFINNVEKILMVDKIKNKDEYIYDEFKKLKNELYEEDYS